MRFHFTLANPQDDAALRQRMRQDTMEGAITVSFRREPSYFLGAGVQGECAQVITCIDTHTGKLAGLGARLQLDAFINGTSQRIGYLSDLRSAPAYRKGTLLARGYQYLEALHNHNPLPFYYSMILEGNETALHTLRGSRAGLPIYRDYGKILTPAIHLDIPRRQFTVPGLRIQPATRAQLPAVFRFIQAQYARTQFAPVYTAKDLDGPRLLGLQAEDILIATRANAIVGTLAAWDQCHFRQTYVEQYSATLQRLRPFYNIMARLSPLKALPKEGAAIPYFYLALVAIQADDPSLFRALLSYLYQQRRRGRWHYFISGLHERHPLAPVLQDYRAIAAAGRLQLVHYPAEQATVQKLDDRIPHIEIGAV